MARIECTMCGACCVAPDIATLGKAIGVPCPHLRPDNRCGIYDNRPAVCREYPADELCEQIEAPKLEQRVANYLRVFGFTPAPPPEV